MREQEAHRKVIKNYTKFHFEINEKTRCQNFMLEKVIQQIENYQKWNLLFGINRTRFQTEYWEEDSSAEFYRPKDDISGDPQ